MAALPNGNQFYFYGPMPFVPKAFPGAGQKNPQKHLDGNFLQIFNVLFGPPPLGPLPAAVVIGKLRLLRAGLDCGYGSQANWNVALALNPLECSELANYRKSRLRMALACIEKEPVTLSWRTKSVYSRVEKSDKGMVSFVMGGIGAYLAAQEWLNAAGDTLNSFLHAGIYANAIGGAGPLIQFLPASLKSPDFFVEALSGDWHVFESKGGVDRAKQLVQGLAQLSGPSQIGWAGLPLQAPRSRVCVHTSVKAEKPLEIHAVDPPGEQAEGGRAYMLIEGVVRSLLMLEATALFKALASDYLNDLKYPEWSMAKTSLLDGISIGIPQTYLKAEREIRIRIAVFLSVRTFLERESERESMQTYPLRLQRFVQEQLDAEKGDASIVIPKGWLARKLQLIGQVPSQANVLYECAMILKLNRLVERLSINASVKRRVLANTQGDNVELTAGGILLLDAVRT